MRRMESYRTEDFYYLKVGTVPTPKFDNSTLAYGQGIGQISFQFPPYLSITPVERQNKGSQLFLESRIAPSEFHQISFKKPLSNEEFQSYLTMTCSMPSASNQKTENIFKIRLSDIMRGSLNKENFTDKRIISSTDSTCKIELTIIPSYNELTTQILEKIVRHEDSKLTVDTFSRLENLSTQQSLGNLQRKGKFKRSTKQVNLRLQKKTKVLETSREMTFVKTLSPAQHLSESPKKSNSPIKRRFSMRRSQLIPQQFYCEMEQVDEQQFLQVFQKNISNVAYVLAILLQIVIILKLMNPSSKV